MTLKPTRMLFDDPSETDEFGTHDNIAKLIEAEILAAQDGRSIAIVGDWGSGKSTIVALLNKHLSRPEPREAHVFIYDAWSHQGDQLRRAFLDDLIASLVANNLINEEQRLEAIDRVWNRVETTTTTSEPLLRRHAKWLLFMLALLPFGWKLFEVPASDKFLEQLCSARNLLGAGLLLALPFSVGILAIIRSWGPQCLQQFFFADSYKDKDFSVLSFFFEKVQGKAERKRIKSPADSIGEFREVFLELLRHIRECNPKMRLVIVVDNIDRIPPEQARDFWSTMQTFFGDGGQRKPVPGKYWLVVPFSEQALSFTFQDKSSGTTSDNAEMKAKARSYIDKTFGLAFYVPRPIMANWRKYLLGKLAAAFFEHEQSELMGVRDLYDYAVSQRHSLTTPRSMKLFVNATVSLYRQRGADVPLAVIAAYELHKDKITAGGAIPDDFLSPMDRRVVDFSDWKSLIAALHYGVTPREATQLLLQDPILAALRGTSIDTLQQQESAPGFFDVLPKVCLQVLDAAQPPSGRALAEIAARIGSLVGKDEPALVPVWRYIRQRSLTADWTVFDDLSASGIEAILSQAPKTEREQLRKAMLSNLSKATPPDVDDKETLRQFAKPWLDTVVALLRSPGDALSASIPGNPKFNLTVLQQVVAAMTPEDIACAIHPTTAGDAIAAALVEEVAAGMPPEFPKRLIKYMDKTLKLEVDWSSVAAAVATRLNVPIESAAEFEWQLRFLSTLARDVVKANGLAILKDLSVRGHLSHYYHTFVGTEVALRAEIVTAILLANPAYERLGEFQNSAAGDALLRSLFKKPASDEAIVATAADRVAEFKWESDLLLTAAQHQPTGSLAIDILVVSLGQTDSQVSVPAKTFVGLKDFIYEQRARILPELLLSKLAERQEVVQLLSNVPFAVDDCFIYASALKALRPEEKRSFLQFLVDGIDGLDSPQWEQLLHSTPGGRNDILSLGQLIKLEIPEYVLKTKARDAILALARGVGSETESVREPLKSQMLLATLLLSPSLRDSLNLDVIDDMMGKFDSKYITNVLSLFNSEVHLNHADDDNRILRRLFHPIVAAPTQISVKWMNQFLASAPTFVDGLSREQKKEFLERLDVSVGTGELGEGVGPELQNTRMLLRAEAKEQKGED